MTTSAIHLSIKAASVPDGSTSNNPPIIAKQKGSETAPAKFFDAASFDPSTRNDLWWNLQVPPDWASALVIRIHWQANATSGSVVWGARVGMTTPADADTPIEHVMATAATTTTATNATEANRLNETVVTVSSLDGMAIADEMFINLYRDAANGSDTCSVAALVLSVSAEYTTL